MMKLDDNQYRPEKECSVTVISGQGHDLLNPTDKQNPRTKYSKFKHHIIIYIYHNHVSSDCIAGNFCDDHCSVLSILSSLFYF